LFFRERIEHYPAWRESKFVDGYIHGIGGWAESGEVLKELGIICKKMGVIIEANTAIERLIFEKNVICCFFLFSLFLSYSWF